MIRVFKDNIYLIAILLVILTSCKSNNKIKNTISQVKTTVDSLQKIYAPDSRVVLWKYKITPILNKVHLNILLDKKLVARIVEKIMKSKFPDIDLNIELLPKKNNRLVVDALANNSVINLRTNPQHSAELATQLLLGTPIKILKTNGEWYLVQTPNRYIAWTDDDAIVKIDKTELVGYKNAYKIVYNKQCGFSFSKPDKNSQVVSDLVIGDILPVIGQNSLFYKVKYPDGRGAWVKKDETITFNKLINRSINTDSLINLAKKFNGLPYLWGGTSSKALDCSGFTSLVYFMNGVLLQRDASQQTKYGKIITTKYEYSDLKKGDLLFFGRPVSDTLPERVTHVALYMGNALFIHASGKVRINSMDSTSKQYIKTYPPRFVRACRINGYIDDVGIQRIRDNTFFKEIIK